MKTPEQWDKEGVCYAAVAKRIQDDATKELRLQLARETERAIQQKEQLLRLRAAMRDALAELGSHSRNDNISAACRILEQALGGKEGK